MLKNFFSQNKNLWAEKEFAYSVITGFFMVVLSLVINHSAGIYINQSNVSYVHDILLDNLPVININFIINECVWAYAFFIIYFAAYHPKTIPFTLKSIALFIFIRSVFISLTHLGPAPVTTFLNPNDWLSSFATGNDKFFSGHTGMPFLFALVFWENKIVRYVSIFTSIFFGFSMLLGHLHYSIDVFAAFFITYTIHVIAQKVFLKDFERLTSQSNRILYI